MEGSHVISRSGGTGGRRSRGTATPIHDLTRAPYAFLLVDALFFKSRDDDRVISRAALIVSGITEDGKREILGIRLERGQGEFWPPRLRCRVRLRSAARLGMAADFPIKFNRHDLLLRGI